MGQLNIAIAWISLGDNQADIEYIESRTEHIGKKIIRRV